MTIKKDDDEKKAADLRVILSPEIANKLRERARIGRRSLQAQAVVEIERGMFLVDEVGIGGKDRT